MRVIVKERSDRACHPEGALRRWRSSGQAPRLRDRCPAKAVYVVKVRALQKPWRESDPSVAIRFALASSG